MATVGTLAQPSAHAPASVQPGKRRVGDVAEQTLTIGNTAAGPAESLNAGMTNPTAGITASGAFAALAPGQTNTTSLRVGIDTSTAGSKVGTATIALESNGEFSGGAKTALTSQTANVSGEVYRLASGQITPAVFADRHGGEPGADHHQHRGQ